MQQSSIRWWWLLAAVLGLRLFSMTIVPLADTTEARYAEVARLMATSGDWITPWFEPAIPFWGKPPLSFWSEALAFRVLGVSEFAARLPSWLVTLGTMALIFALARSFYGTRTARWAVLIYSTCVLPYMVSGAVLTDPFLAFGTTLSMTAFALASRQPRLIWRYGFFVGLSIGLLAKGPLALILIAGSLLPWMLWHRNASEYLCAMPWWRGTLLTVVLTLPWYIAAELKTPGFLNYFIVGEHFLRFLDSGWAGDLYGSAHQRPFGSIWPYWVMASFPWGLIGAYALLVRMTKRSGREKIRLALKDSRLTYLLFWSLFTLAFFTMAGNILWTYVLPALPAFAIVLANYVVCRHPGDPVYGSRLPWVATAVVPVGVLMFALVFVTQPERLRTEKALVSHVKEVSEPGDQLLFVGSRSFSGRFYSDGTAGLVSLEQLPDVIAAAPAALHLAIPKDLVGAVETRLARQVKASFENNRYVLLTLPAAG